MLQPRKMLIKSLLYLNESSLVAAIQKKFGIKERPLQEGEHQDFLVGNRFWYYLFALGTTLGDEIFYASFIPFWFWNVDGAVGRRVVFIWTFVMYIGQLAKDIIKWPRPSYPAKRLQKKWAEEYGMPSTHAMVSISIPVSIIHFTKNRYIYSVNLCVAASVVWCAVISVSRLYFGMHTVLDVIVGLWLALALTLTIIPVVDELDHFWISATYGPHVMLVVTVILILCFPRPEHWTPTRGDTTMIISVCAGIHIGAWNNYRLGHIVFSKDPPPYPIIWPDYYMTGLGFLRTIIGFLLILATRNFLKNIFQYLFFWMLRYQLFPVFENHQMKMQSFIDLFIKFVTYFFIGFNTVYAIPVVFRYFGIERPTFYTEI